MIIDVKIWNGMEETKKKKKKPTSCHGEQLVLTAMK